MQSIAVFDSGIGGLSVLAELKKALPNEDFFFFADAQNAPYGDKKREDIQQLMLHNTAYFFEQNCKAVVLGCNTVTAASAELLRKKWSREIIIGIEPALKPALEKTAGKVLIMATDLTIKEKKLHELAKALGQEERLIYCACPGLMQLVEENPFSEKTEDYLKKLLADKQENVSAIVLGCTHYSFLKPVLTGFYPDIPLFDGNEGVARHLKNILREKKLLNSAAHKGEIFWHNSFEDKKKNEAYNAFCKEFYEKL